jgi:hypothetical protein
VQHDEIPHTIKWSNKQNVNLISLHGEQVQTAKKRGKEGLGLGV